MKKKLFVALSFSLIVALPVNLSFESHGNIAYAEQSRKEEKYKDTDFMRYIEDDIDIFYTEKTSSLSSKDYAKSFFHSATKILREEYKNLKNGVIFVDKVKATDESGKETKINSIIVYLSPGSISKINFNDKKWGENPKDIYTVADAVFIKEDIATDEFQAKSGNEEAPDAYFMLTIEGY